MTRSILMITAILLLSLPAWGDFTIEELSDDLDKVSVNTFPLIVASEVFENTDEKTGSFYDDPDSRYLRCPSSVLEKAMRFGQLMVYGVPYTARRVSGEERELELHPVAQLLDRLRLRKIEDYEGATRGWFTFVSMTEDLASQRSGKPLTVERFWEVENLGVEFNDRLWELVEKGIHQHLEALESDGMKPLPFTYTAEVGSVELLEYSYEDGELYIKLNMWFREIEENERLKNIDPRLLQQGAGQSGRDGRNRQGR